MSGFVGAAGFVSRTLAVLVFCLVVGTVLKLTLYDTGDCMQAVTETVPMISTVHREQEQLFKCRLPQLDPWDPEVTRLLKPNEDPFKNCKPIARGISWLRDGKVVVNETLLALGVECQFRCNFRGHDEYTIKFGGWTNVSYPPECDIIEVRCTLPTAIGQRVFYEFLHVQAYRTGDVRVENPTHEAYESKDFRPPDVHLFVFDSVSSGEFFRSMLRTTHLLRERMEAVPFRFVNKLGINSHPNAYALLMGKRNEPLEASPMNDAIPPIKDRDAICNEYLDNETFVGFDFKRHGYATLWSEDWGDWSSFLFPHCKGFKKPQWTTTCRRIRETKQGELEDNNPVAIVAVPERLRSNKHLMTSLRRNSRQLVTRYDHFATFHSILNVLHTSQAGRLQNWRNMTPEATFSAQPGWSGPAGLEFHGQSYLYPFEDAGTRTCANQMVPFQYCICQYESVDRTKTDRSLAERLAHFMVGRVNADLVSHNVTNLCAALSLDVARPIELIEWDPSAQQNVFRVTFDTVPGQGRFWGYVRIEGNTTENTADSYTLLTRRLSRLDTYRYKAFCLPDSMAKPYCYCKQLLETTSRTPPSSAGS